MTKHAPAFSGEKMDNKFVRCKEDDPNRCPAATRDGQCPYLAVEGCTHCPRHGGVQQSQKLDHNRLNNYRLTKAIWKSKISEKANNPNIRNLSDEIGIIRVVIEETIEKCTDSSTLLTFSDKLTNLVGQVQRLVEASQKLDERNKELLPRNIIIIVADSIVTILGRYIQDPDELLRVSEEIGNVIANVGSFQGTDQPRAIA